MGQQKKIKKGGHSFRNPHGFPRQDNPLWKQHGGAGRTSQSHRTHCCSLESERAADRRKDDCNSARHRGSLQSHSKSPHRALRTQGTQNFGSGIAQLDPLLTRKLHGFLDTRVLFVQPPLPPKNKNQSPPDYMEMLLPEPFPSCVHFHILSHPNTKTHCHIHPGSAYA